MPLTSCVFTLSAASLALWIWLPKAREKDPQHPRSAGSLCAHAGRIRAVRLRHCVLSRLGLVRPSCACFLSPGCIRISGCSVSLKQAFLPLGSLQIPTELLWSDCAQGCGAGDQRPEQHPYLLPNRQCIRDTPSRVCTLTDSEEPGFQAPSHPEPNVFYHHAVPCFSQKRGRGGG